MPTYLSVRVEEPIDLVGGRATPEDVTDVAIIAVDSDRTEGIIEKLASAADERLTMFDLIGARGLTKYTQTAMVKMPGEMWLDIGVLHSSSI